jgi:protein-L-isoaspartate O-methyltransferase
MVCFDIRGQYGWRALAFAKLGAKVVTFEHDAEVLQRLRRNLELKVDVVERFVGTAALRLDELGRADAIKVDVDGGELGGR